MDLRKPDSSPLKEIFDRNIGVRWPWSIGENERVTRDHLKPPSKATTGSSPSSAKDETKSGEPPLRILSIDGGGVRGLIPALVLRELEEQADTPCREMFDVVAGCSSGALIALGLFNSHNPLSADTIAESYRTQSENVFSRHIIKDLGVFDDIGGKYVGVRYSSKALRKMVGDILSDDVLLSEAHARILVPAVDLDLRRVEIFDSDWGQSKMKMVDVALASTAAPTYFDPHRIQFKENDDPRLFVDGGIAINDPAAVAVAKHWGEIQKRGAILVSLGTGEADKEIGPDQFDNSGPLSWLDELPGLTIDSSSHGTYTIVEDLFRALSESGVEADHARINPRLGSRIPLDDADKETLRALSMSVTKWLKNDGGKEQISELARSLRH